MSSQFAGSVSPAESGDVLEIRGLDASLVQSRCSLSAPITPLANAREKIPSHGHDGSLSWPNATIEKLAAGDDVQSSRVTVTTCRAGRRAGTSLDPSRLQRRTHRLGACRALPLGARLAASGQELEDHAAANQVWPACDENSTHCDFSLLRLFTSRASVNV
jgi:hypothetical protein